MSGNPTPPAAASSSALLGSSSPSYRRPVPDWVGRRLRLSVGRRRDPLTGDEVGLVPLWGSGLGESDALCLVPGIGIGVLGVEATHGGRRRRTWCWVGRLTAGGLELTVELVQPRHHRRPGPVASLLRLVDDLVDLGGDRLPAAAPDGFWLAAGRAAADGCEPRRPNAREVAAWTARPLWRARHPNQPAGGASPDIARLGGRSVRGGGAA